MDHLEVWCRHTILNLLWNQTHAAQGSDIPQDASKDGDYRREDHVRHHNDMSIHVGQVGAEPVRKTVRGVLGNLTSCLPDAHRL